MHILLNRQHNRECPRSSAFYQCAANGFQGCCQVDPFALSGCPDSSSILLTPSVATATDAVPIPTLLKESSTSASNAKVHTITSVDGDRTVFITVTEQSAPTANVRPPDKTAADSNKGVFPIAGPVAGGVVGGFAALALALFILYLYRSRRQARERREATVPPTFSVGDMSEELAGANAAKHASDEKADLANISQSDPGHDPLPQLDSAMVRPTIELGEGPLGSIPELAATSRTTLNIPLPPSPIVNTSKPNRNSASWDPEDHVMSWMQLNSESSGCATATLSQPHNVPDVTVAVWENMAAQKPTKAECLQSDTST